MKRTYIYGLFIMLCALFVFPVLSQKNMHYLSQAQASGTPQDTYGDQIGTVIFPASCSDGAKSYVERGVALLHHMTYDGANAAFINATRTDPDCAMGYWGQAMTYIHPLWSDAPSKKDFERGRELIDKAAKRGPKTDREQAYIAAVRAYYDQGWNKSEAANLQKFEAGWESVYRRFPEDIEAALFHALAHLATADPADKTYTKQKKAGAIAEKVLAQVSDHPGAHHYLIHAYDYPPLAHKALSAARSYGKIAPDIPHALHMPTHIFTRLGLWEESIAMNKRSAAAALKHPAGRDISLHYPHALDYQVYAYLQQADDDKANQVMRDLLISEGTFQTHIAAAYSFTAIPARVALERQKWTDAAGLKTWSPNNYPIENFPAMEAITYFAKALGAARSGHMEMADQAIKMLSSLHQKAEKTSAYWAKQVEIQLLSAKAWMMYQQEKKDQALNIMQTAADLESTTEKHPVTPGEVLPARELLADMFFEMGRYREALGEYDTVLERSPNRFNSLFGAGMAAERVDDKNRAIFYYEKIVEMSQTVKTDRKQLQHAKQYISQNGVSS